MNEFVKTILIIDDEVSIRQSFADYLEDRNYRTLTAENGRIGLKVFEQEKPDMVLVDLRMPDMDGLEVLARVKAISPDTPLIVVSGTGMIGDAVEALHLGAWDYILKPIVDFDVLLHAIETALERAELKTRNRHYQEHLKAEVNRKTRELNKSEQQYRMLAENINDVIWTTDLEFRFTYISPSVKRTQGYDPAELIGKSALDLLTPESQSVAAGVFTEEINRGSKLGFENASRVVELEQFNKNGDRVWVEIQAVFLLDENRRPKGLLAVSRDATYRKQLETHLRQAQKMEAIGTLAGGIAHDFNNILGAILGYTELASMASGTNTKIQNYHANILKAAYRAKELTTQILSFSRNTLKERHPVHIIPVIREALQLLRASVPASINIDFQNKSDDDIVICDPGDIHQIVMNLCTNAYQAIGANVGKINLKLTHLTLAADQKMVLMDVQPGEYILLSVHDTGPGMDRETLEKIYDPYFTTKSRFKGTGLGLAVVHGIVKDLNGAIRAHSKIGKGTTFQVYLPLSIAVQKTGKPEPTAPLPRGNEHILFVDDEPMLIDIGRDMLSQLGYRVSSASNGRQASALVRTYPERYDLIVTDLNMPEMTGCQLAEEITKIKPGIPIVLCTGNPQQISDAKARQIGIRSIAQKPLSLIQLATVVRRVLERKET